MYICMFCTYQNVSACVDTCTLSHTCVYVDRDVEDLDADMFV